MKKINFFSDENLVKLNKSTKIHLLSPYLHVILNFLRIQLCNKKIWRTEILY